MIKILRISLVGALALIGSTLLNQATATPFTWMGGFTNNSWTNSRNWESTSEYPGIFSIRSDSATIGDGSTVNLNTNIQPVSAVSLGTNSSLNIQASGVGGTRGHLQSDQVTNNGTISVLSGADINIGQLSGSGQIIVNGVQNSLNFYSASSNNNVQRNNSVINIITGFVSSGNLDNSGTIKATGVHEDGNFKATVGSGSKGTVMNSGLIEADGGNLILQANVKNTSNGVIAVNKGSINLDGNIQGGQVQVNNGDLKTTRVFTPNSFTISGGDISVAESGSILAQNSSQLTISSTLTNNGEIAAEATSTTAGGSVITLQGSEKINNGLIRATGTAAKSSKVSVQADVIGIGSWEASIAFLCRLWNF